MQLSIREYVGLSWNKTPHVSPDWMTIVVGQSTSQVQPFIPVNANPHKLVKISIKTL
eukprot:Pgem_evm1s6137